MLDPNTIKRFEEALASDRLDELGKQMIAEGLSQVAIYHQFNLFSKFLGDAREADRETVYCHMECIIGYCSPGNRWFDHYLTNEEIDAYRKTIA